MTGSVAPTPEPGMDDAASLEGLLSGADDRIHPFSADVRETETCWFSFYEPTRRLTGYLYFFVRPNIGVCSGGALVWDDRSYLAWEALHHDYRWHTPAEVKAGQALADLPIAVVVEVLEPLHRYRATYDADGLTLDLTATAVTVPFVPPLGEPPFRSARHLDQPMHIQGSLELGGEQITIDCIGMRDRSWGPRDDRRVGRFGYAFATASSDLAFLAYSSPRADDDEIFSGYLLRDGVRRPLVEGQRTLARDPAHGGPVSVRIDARDDQGRELHAVGIAVNRLCFTPYPRMLNWTTTLQWELDGTAAIGEDQDVWSTEAWSSWRRAVAAQATP